MDTAFPELRDLRYPGRVIIIGMNPDGLAFACYAVTGRSPSSQARRILPGDDNTQLLVTPTDEAALKTGNPDLLIYPCFMFGDSFTAVSNGKQTPSLQEGGQRSACETLAASLDRWDYEPDEPAWTPRISGCIRTSDAALAICKRSPHSDQTIRSYFTVALEKGRASLIATYSGENRNPLPSFEGEPRGIAFPCRTPREAAEQLYSALSPPSGEDDFRVAAAAVSHPDHTSAVVNRHS